jgi:pimeloyl-ACP methyl ester carboxylesterase
MAAGHRVVAAANPLRGVASDAAAIGDLVRSIDGPVVLVGHSYGGAVITNIPPDAGDVASLVYVGAFAPDAGESANALAQQFPGSTLGEALTAVPRADGTTDMYIRGDRFHHQFCADVPAAHAVRMAVTQRPVALEALNEASRMPLWRQRPSWFVFGDADLNIPAALERFFAKRAGAHAAVELAGASHALAVSRPDAVAGVILQAAELRVAA